MIINKRPNFVRNVPTNIFSTIFLLYPYNIYYIFINMENEDYIEEKQIPNQPKSLTKYQFEIIKEQMEKCTCLINCKDGGLGTGFFCKIPFPDFYNLLPVLLTNNHIIGEEDLKLGNEIHITFQKNKKISIYIDNTRKIHSIKKPMDITMIEIKKVYCLNIDDFFEIDERIFSENGLKYENNTIYLLHYPKGREIEFSVGVIKKIDNDNIMHLCNTEPGSSGGCIVKLDNFKVIGIHKGSAKKNNDYNVGTLFKAPLKEFWKKYENLKENLNENKQKSDEIILEYKIEKGGIFSYFFNNKIKIFGDKFVKNNKDKCELFVFGEKYELNSHFNKSDIRLNNNIFKIILKGINKITDLSGMFEGCTSLISINGLSDYNLVNISDISSVFEGCESLTSLPDISNWNTINIRNMSNLFRGCTSLEKIPDISKWKTDNLINMSGLFASCQKLTSLPDISNWNISNVNDISELFSFCQKLSSLPDISKWNILNVKNMGGLFSGCQKLSSLPDISKWNTGNVENIRIMFSVCYELKSLPDISKWNTINIKNINNLFGLCADCLLLESIPDISQWDIVKDLNKKSHNSIDLMFRNCNKLSRPYYSFQLIDFIKENSQNK